MKIINAFFILNMVLFSSLSQAELITPVVLSPLNSSFSAIANQNTTYPAWVYEGDNDIWTFDLTAFDTNASANLTIRDYAAPADDYNVYLDGVLLGNTGFGVEKLFQFETSAAIHTVGVEWLNPIAGGSWYIISIDVTPSAVPVPAAAWLFGSGLIGLVGLAKRKSKA